MQLRHADRSLTDCLFAVHKQVTKNPAFEKTPLFVFLNKKDLFEDYIRVKVSLLYAPFVEMVRKVSG